MVYTVSRNELVIFGTSADKIGDFWWFEDCDRAQQETVMTEKLLFYDKNFKVKIGTPTMTEAENCRNVGNAEMIFNFSIGCLDICTRTNFYNLE